jgi:ferric-dicitrate binding protein FerR (iron transport regulator)
MQNIESKILGYLAETLEVSERRMVDEWVAHSEENKLLFEQVKTVFELSYFDTDSFEPDVDSAWAGLEEKLFSDNNSRHVKLNLKFFYRVAAIFVFATSFSFLAYFTLNNDNSEYATGANEVKEFNLADGSIIILNKNSSIEYSESFNDEIREVSLDGQAYFKVASDVNRPFIISGTSAVIKVLGTSFDFLSIDGYSNVNVSSGKVVFAANENFENKLVLSKDEQGKLEDDKFEKLSGLDESVIEWRFEELNFKSTPMSEVVEVLSKHYDVRFKINKNIKDCLITSSFQGQELDSILETLEIIANITNTRKGNTISLSGPGC